MNSDCVWLSADDLHQDAGFLVGDARRSLLRHGGANVALALDRSDALCGGFEVLGGTHALGSVKDLKGRYDTGGADDEALFDQSQRTCPKLLPSDALIFHPLLAHGSAANRSGRRRRLATLWFVGSPDPEDEAEAQRSRGSR